MDLYVIRHAEAVELGQDGITEDSERSLTQKGTAQARTVAEGLRWKGVDLAAIVTSPLLRARQTAEEMLRAWPAPAPELRVSDRLAPGGKRRKLARFLSNLGGDRIALVGHEPDLSGLVGWLIGSKKAQIDLAKAGVAFLTCRGEPGKAACTLNWLVRPEWLER